MITALASAVVGLVSGAVPDLLKEFTAGREHQREMERMDKQAELQLRVAQMGHDSRMRELSVQAEIEDGRAWSDRMTAMIEAQARPTGIAWVDAFNALLRPATAAAIILLFIATAGVFVSSVYGSWWAGHITAEAMALTIWGSLVGESIQAVLGFLFGYRSAAKKS